MALPALAGKRERNLSRSHVFSLWYLSSLGELRAILEITTTQEFTADVHWCSACVYLILAQRCWYSPAEKDRDSGHDSQEGSQKKRGRPAWTLQAWVGLVCSCKVQRMGGNCLPPSASIWFSLFSSSFSFHPHKHMHTLEKEAISGLLAKTEITPRHKKKRGKDTAGRAEHMFV